MRDFMSQVCGVIEDGFREVSPRDRHWAPCRYSTDCFRKLSERFQPFTVHVQQFWKNSVICHLKCFNKNISETFRMKYFYRPFRLIISETFHMKQFNKLSKEFFLKSFTCNKFETFSWVIPKTFHLTYFYRLFNWVIFKTFYMT